MFSFCLSSILSPGCLCLLHKSQLFVFLFPLNSLAGLEDYREIIFLFASKFLLTFKFFSQCRIIISCPAIHLGPKVCPSLLYQHHVQVHLHRGHLSALFLFVGFSLCARSPDKVALFVHLPVPLPRWNEPGGNQDFFKFSFVFALEPRVTFFKFCLLNSGLVKFLSTDQTNIFWVQMMTLGRGLGTVRTGWWRSWGLEYWKAGSVVDTQNYKLLHFKGGCRAELVILQKLKWNFHLDPCTLFGCPMVHRCADTRTIIQGHPSPWKPHLGRV